MIRGGSQEFSICDEKDDKQKSVLVMSGAAEN
jgi:hypothetical protein